MPTYTYTCTTCNNHIEKRQSFTDPPLTTCEECGGTLRKIIHPVGIVFKGSGWYVTDSRSSSSSTNGPSTTPSESKSSAKDSSSKESGSKESSGAKESTPANESTGSKESSPSTSSASSEKT